MQTLAATLWTKRGSGQLFESSTVIYGTLRRYTGCSEQKMYEYPYGCTDLVNSLAESVVDDWWWGNFNKHARAHTLTVSDEHTLCDGLIALIPQGTLTGVHSNLTDREATECEDELTICDALSLRQVIRWV